MPRQVGESREFLDDPKSKLAGIVSSGHDNRKLAIFVHGYRGNYLGTWGRLADELKKEVSSPFLEWDFLFLGYDTSRLGSYADIADLIRTQITLASQGSSFAPVTYEKFCIVGHSLGTLGIRQLLCDHPSHQGTLLLKVHSVLLWGSPSVGSTLAPYARLLLRDQIADWLRPGCGQLAMLRQWTQTYLAFVPGDWPRVEIIYGLADQVVGGGGGVAAWPGDRPALADLKGHISMKEPGDWDVDQVKKFLRMVLQ